MKNDLPWLLAAMAILTVILIFVLVCVYYMTQRLAEFEAIIEFLRIWIEQNDLQITPPGQTT